MTPADLLAARPDLRLSWEDGQPFIRWDGTLPAEVVAAIKGDRAGVVDLLRVRGENAATACADGAPGWMTCAACGTEWKAHPLNQRPGGACPACVPRPAQDCTPRPVNMRNFAALVALDRREREAGR